jgi:hypothetical protein
MDLEKRVNEGGNFRQTAIDIALAAASTTAAYNIAGGVCGNVNIDKDLELALTAGILTAGGILGYKARSIFNRMVYKKKRNFARIKTIREMEKNTEFLERQGIKRKKLTKTQSALKYLLTVPLGGALGYFPGMAGVAPLCIYFGENYSQNWATGSLTAGPIAGAIAGMYAFGEMTAKKQYKRIAITTSALAGITTAAMFTNKGSFSPLDSGFIKSNGEIGLWLKLGACAASGLIAGAIGNKIYKNHAREKQNNSEE